MLQKEIFPETCNQEINAIGRQVEDRIERETLPLKLICLIRKICVWSCNAIDALVSVALQFVENAAARNITSRTQKTYAKQGKNILILVLASRSLKNTRFQCILKFINVSTTNCFYFRRLLDRGRNSIESQSETIRTFLTSISRKKLWLSQTVKNKLPSSNLHNLNLQKGNTICYYSVIIMGRFFFDSYFSQSYILTDAKSSE